MRKIFLIAAAALIIGGLFLMGGAFVASGMDFTRFDTNNYQENHYAVTEAFQNIDIQANEARITLQYAEAPAGSSLTAEIHCTEREKTTYNVRVENGTLRISMDDRRKWYDYIAMFSKSLTLQVILPQKEYAALTVNGQTGDVTVPGDFSFTGAEIKTSTGDVSYSAAVQDGLTVRTSTGSIGLNGVSAGQINLSVSTGKITAEQVSCREDLSVRVSTGKTVLSGLTCRNLVSSGDTGRITLKDVTADEAIQIERSTGDVSFEHSDAGTLTVKTSTGNVTGTLRSEKIFSASSSTGSVHVPECLTGGRCELRTSTGRIDIQIAS